MVKSRLVRDIGATISGHHMTGTATRVLTPPRAWVEINVVVEIAMESPDSKFAYFYDTRIKWDEILAWNWKVNVAQVILDVI